MGDRIPVLQPDLMDWLLAEDNPPVRYWTLRDLLQKGETDPEVQRTKGQIPFSSEIQHAFVNNEVHGGPFWSRADGNIYWGSFSTVNVLIFLAETGISKADPRISALVEFVLGYQAKEGFFKLGPKGPGWWSCFTASVLGALLRFGCGDDERVAKGINWLFHAQREDGGWYCTKNALKGGPKAKLESCPHAVLNVLWAFAVTPALRDRPELVPAVEFLLRHWATKIPIPDVDRGRYGIGSRFQWIKYPLFEYHLLKYTYILSHYKQALRDKRLAEAVALLVSKQDSRGRWTIDKPYRGWEEFEFGTAGSPSKWATLDALRVVRRLHL